MSGREPEGIGYGSEPQRAVRAEHGRASGAPPLPPPRWRLFVLPIVIFVLLAVLTLVLWHEESNQYRATLRAHVSAHQVGVARRLEQSILQRVKPIFRLAIEWQQGGLRDERQFAAAADHVARVYQGNYRFIGW